MKKLIFTIIKILIAFFLLFLLFSQIDTNQLKLVLYNTNIYPVIVAALLFYLGIYLSVLRWQQCLLNFNIRVSTLKLYSIYCISSFFNNFLPSSIGGDVYKIISLKKNFPNQNKVLLSSIIQDRAMGFITMLILNIAISILFIDIIYKNIQFLILESIIVFIFISLCILYIFRQLVKDYINNLKENLIIDKIFSIITYLSKFSSKKIFIQSFLLSVLFSLLVAYAKFIVFNALDMKINFLYVVLISTVTQIASILPISFNSIGITEGLSVFLYSLIGIPAEVSLTVALIGRFSSIITSALGGMFYFFKDKIEY